ncbi:MAG: hypothetical protein II453_01035, partial [Alphaproteobacteria bacterium]|nr:hypothetical protein [Alphaproteobacteria bacterium]
MVSLVIEVICIFYSNSIRIMEEERKKLRVIHVFDNGEDAAIEMAGRSDKTITPPGISCAMGEQQVLMNVAFHVYFYLF